MIISMFGMGLPELLLIFFIVFILFGAKKLPELGSGLGSAIKNFKQAMNEGKTEDKDKDKNLADDSKPPKPLS
jgi:sec-independent protein translocase protein TatA